MQRGGGALIGHRAADVRKGIHLLRAQIGDDDEARREVGRIGQTIGVPASELRVADPAGEQVVSRRSQAAGQAGISEHAVVGRQRNDLEPVGVGGGHRRQSPQGERTDKEQVESVFEHSQVREWGWVWPGWQCELVDLSLLLKTRGRALNKRSGLVRRLALRFMCGRWPPRTHRALGARPGAVRAK